MFPFLKGKSSLRRKARQFAESNKPVGTEHITLKKVNRDTISIWYHGQDEHGKFLIKQSWTRIKVEPVDENQVEEEDIQDSTWKMIQQLREDIKK
jgi:hypothetical protein